MDRLFQPLMLGNVELKHRVIMAPLTRFRATDAHVPTKCAREYYEQRALVPGTLLITEATFVSPRAAGYRNVPGIWNKDQVEAWRKITDAVHARGSFIYVQLWALGRTADPEVLREEGGYSVVSPSAIGMNTVNSIGQETVQESALTEAEIREYIQDFASAARNAMEAGFDGVEIHGANGYLVDQFWQDVVNQRTDAYGGSIENRARFGLEVTKAVIDAVGNSNRVGMRLSPWFKGQGMGMQDPIPQFLYITQQLKGLDLAYLHLVEGRISGTNAADAGYKAFDHENDVFINAWGDQKPILLAGGFTPEKADKVANELHRDKNVGVVFGRYFISNPDLPFRIQNRLKLGIWDRPSFYTAGKAQGYTDYAFSEQWGARGKVEPAVCSIPA